MICSVWKTECASVNRLVSLPATCVRQRDCRASCTVDNKSHPLPTVGCRHSHLHRYSALQRYFLPFQPLSRDDLADVPSSARIPSLVLIDCTFSNKTMWDGMRGRKIRGCPNAAREPCESFIYLPLCSCIFSSTVTASALVV
jgi:hypothetical protein